MNPKEFSWSAEQQVTVTNPTAEDFEFKVHGKEYVVNAGATVKMPGYMAWMYVNKIATQAAQADNEFLHWNEENFRQKYYNRYVIGAEEIMQVVEEQPVVEAFDSVDLEENAPEELPAAPLAHAAQTQNIAPMRTQDERSTEA